MDLRSTLQAVTGETGSRDHDYRLLAVLVRLERDEHAEPELWGQ